MTIPELILQPDDFGYTGYDKNLDSPILRKPGLVVFDFDLISQALFDQDKTAYEMFRKNKKIKLILNFPSQLPGEIGGAKKLVYLEYISPEPTNVIIYPEKVTIDNRNTGAILGVAKKHIVDGETRYSLELDRPDLQKHNRKAKQSGTAPVVSNSNSYRTKI